MGKRTPYCNHSENTTCIHCMDDKANGEAMRWMCRHGPGQMCPNCVNLKKGEKVELEFLCHHGPNQYCTNCLPAEENKNLKHMSFEDYINKEKSLCLHGPNQKCPHCTMPTLPSYKVKKYCSYHKPYPLGLCTNCSPKPCTLARQKYRHVDNIQVVDKKCLDLFVQNWINYGERTQFAAFLFGRYQRREGANGVREVALVYGLYKMKQHFQNGRIIIDSDDYAAAVNGVSSALGLTCIGVIYTSAPRNDVLTSFDVDFVAPLQLKYKQRGDFSSKFVSVVISRNKDKQIEPYAFMLSDQCMCMYRDGLFLKPKSPEKCISTTTGKNKELLSSVIRNDAKLGSQVVTEFEPLFFLVELTISMAKTANLPIMFLSNDYPAVNANNETKDTLIKELMNSLRKGRGSPERMRSIVSDFNLLIELASVLGVESVIDICDSVANKKTIAEKSMNLLEILMQSEY